MKTLLTITLIAMATTVWPQSFDVWEKVSVTDEFGDTTGRRVQRILVEGSFSNSATAGSKMLARVVDYGDAIMMSLFEYMKAPEASMCHDGCFGTVYIKRANGEIETHEAFAPKAGGVYFSEGSSFHKFFRENSGEEIKVYIKQDQFSEYGRSTYLFTITIP